MKARIISLNAGGPEKIEWLDKSSRTSMHRRPIEGPLVVHFDRVDDNSFAVPKLHGLEFSVLYALGEKSLASYLKSIGHDAYVPGALGENVTLDDLDETKISVGDVFRFGEVEAQAVYPRIPCAKVNLRMRHPQAQKLFESCGRSGVYFRILKPGKIHRRDSVERIEEATTRISISDLYARLLKKTEFTAEERALALRNGAFPKAQIAAWRALDESTES